MRIRASRRRQWALAAAGLLAAGALTGCRAGGTPFAYNGVARGDIGAVPTSPAFAQVAAGQRLGDPKGTVTFIGAPMPAGQEVMSPGGPLTMVHVSGQPVVGSGGMVYPVGYTTGGQMMMAAPAMNMQPAPQAPTQTYQVMMVPSGQPMPTTGAPIMPAAMPQQQPVMMAMPAAAPTATTGGQQMVFLVQGPNGPQYMIAEVMPAAAPAAPPAMPAMPAPAVTMPPTPASAPAITPAAGTMSAATPFAAAPPLPTPSAPEPAAAPTFNPPPPANVSMPMLPPPPPSEPKAPEKAVDKAPEPLPPGVGAKPSAGPVLPVVHAPEPALAPFPPTPVKDAPPSVKLPPATGAVEGDIPPAPVFVPAPAR